MKQKNYTSAPLPFQGQKRRHVKEFCRVLDASAAPIYVDLFGGSGLLSHTVKYIHPQARVIYNDFDNFHVRLESVEMTNLLLSDLRNILTGYPKDKKITGDLREFIIQRLKVENGRGYPADWITISSALLFSMNYALSFAEFEKQSLYNSIRATDYIVDGYLDGLEIVRLDYRELFELYKNIPNAIFIIDPPYLSTDASTYSSNNYWKLKDYLDVLTVLKGISYVYFTSNKSNIIELAEWMECNLAAINPFSGALRKDVCSNTTYNTKYTDIMLCRIIKPSSEGFIHLPIAA